MQLKLDVVGAATAMPLLALQRLPVLYSSPAGQLVGTPASQFGSRGQGAPGQSASTPNKGCDARENSELVDEHAQDFSTLAIGWKKTH